MIWLGEWGIEESPSSRAECGYCHKKIPHGELRIAMPKGRWNTLGFHHFDCWRKKVERTIEYHGMGYEKASYIEEGRRGEIIRRRIAEITREAKSKKLRIGP
jgi:hypothetical protein